MISDIELKKLIICELANSTITVTFLSLPNLKTDIFRIATIVKNEILNRAQLHQGAPLSLLVDASPLGSHPPIMSAAEKEIYGQILKEVKFKKVCVISISPIIRISSSVIMMLGKMPNFKVVGNKADALKWLSDSVAP